MTEASTPFRPASPAGGNPIRALWDRLHPLPGGRRLFSVLLGRMAPYTGSIRPQVRELRPGFARVQMRDRPRLRNHLGSIHAVALANLAEVASGLALVYALPDDARAILTALNVEFVKKARGTLTAEAEVEVPRSSERQEYRFDSLVRDASGEVVARATAHWLVGPRDATGGEQ